MRHVQPKNSNVHVDLSTLVGLDTSSAVVKVVSAWVVIVLEKVQDALHDLYTRTRKRVYL